ncbi:MAG: ribonuclease J [Candidatus Wildermuthbacteria bacterium]|nr:ribonuclease J [Candidatus Wildermuthbacteria bacterium]
MIAKTSQPTVKIIPLGGLGEVGRNMAVLEYHDQHSPFHGKLIVIDIGFRMPEEDMPGIDFIIPNAAYLKGREKDILGVLITHGHYDHIGAMPYIMGQIGNPVVYTGALSRAIITKRQEDFPDQPKLNVVLIENGKRFKLGPFEVEPFRQTHSIADNFGFAIKTPVGIVVHTSDFKFDESPVNEPPTDLNKLQSIGDRNIHLLMSDSTNSQEPGHSLSEKAILENLDELFKRTQGRLIIATFASLLNRVQQIITLSEKYGRKVMFEGYSMKTNTEIARQLGYLKAQKGTIIKTKDIGNYPDSKITVVCTGAQGEGRAVLMRIVNGEHQILKIQKGDTVVFSSSVIPGNERTVQFVKDQLYRQKAEVFHYKMMDIHASGHGNQEELKAMIHLMRPKFLMPVHGQYSMLVNHQKLAIGEGIPEKNILLADNGMVINLTKQGFTIDKKPVPSNYVMVDGLGVGDVGEIVLRDRQNLSQGGMFVVIAVVDRQTGRVKGSPDIISRGFIYLRESKDLLRQVRKRTIDIVEKSSGSVGAVNWSYVKESIRNKIGDFLFEKTQRRPIVIPVVIEV